MKKRTIIISAFFVAGFVLLMSTKTKPQRYTDSVIEKVAKSHGMTPENLSLIVRNLEKERLIQREMQDTF